MAKFIDRKRPATITVDLIKTLLDNGALVDLRLAGDPTGPPTRLAAEWRDLRPADSRHAVGSHRMIPVQGAIFVSPNRQITGQTASVGG